MHLCLIMLYMKYSNLRCVMRNVTFFYIQTELVNNKMAFLLHTFHIFHIHISSSIILFFHCAYNVQNSYRTDSTSHMPH